MEQSAMEEAGGVYGRDWAGPSPEVGGSAEMQAHIARVLWSWRKASGKGLFEEQGADKEDPAWQAVHEREDVALLSVGVQEDPVVNYGNVGGMKIFEMDWARLTTMPGRFTAEPHSREERQQLLDQVKRDGYTNAYNGVRISSTGKRFRLRNTKVWNVLADDGTTILGQAACFPLDNIEYIDTLTEG